MTQEQLYEVLWRYGWGPKWSAEEIVFRREGNGWRLGNGVIVTPWLNTEVPDDPWTALCDIYWANGLRPPETP